MADQKVKTREEALAPIIARAWHDKNFKQELLKDPKAVIKKEKGIDVPANVKITVVEESADQLYIILPQKPKSGDLSEEQLEAVAGGVCVPAVVVAGVVTVIGGAALGAGIEQGHRHGW